VKAGSGEEKEEEEEEEEEAVAAQQHALAQRARRILEFVTLVTLALAQRARMILEFGRTLDYLSDLMSVWLV
jgi:hypothetical protein